MGVAGATLRAILTDGDGEPVASPGTVTVSVMDDTGAAVACSAVVAGSRTGEQTAALTSARTDVGTLTATWSVDSVARAITRHLVVSGRIFSRSELRGERGLDNTVTWPNWRLDDAITQAEQLAEDQTGASWVRRHSLVTLNAFDATNRHCLIVSRPRLISVRSLTIGGVASTGYLVQGDEIAITAGLPSTSTATLSITHGYDGTTAELRRALIEWAAGNLLAESNSISPRATGYDSLGTPISFARQGKDPTNLDKLNAVLRRYDHRIGLA